MPAEERLKSKDEDEKQIGRKTIIPVIVGHLYAVTASGSNYSTQMLQMMIDTLCRVV